MLARLNSLVMGIFDSHKFENSILLLVEYFAVNNGNYVAFLYVLPIRRICAAEKSRCSD